MVFSSYAILTIVVLLSVGSQGNVVWNSAPYRELLALEETGENVLFNNESKVPPIPTNVTVLSFTNVSLFLTWQEPEPTDQSVLNYYVRWKEDRLGRMAPTSNSFYNITDLNPNTKYIVQVTARTQSGFGPWTEEVRTRTDSGVPSSPTDPAITSFTTTSLSLTWGLPVPDMGPITRYKMQWTLANGSSHVRNLTYNETSFTITNLTTYTNYTVRILAETSAGPGPWSQEISATTGVGGAPGQARNIFVEKVTSTSIRFLFWGPRNTGGLPITHFVVRWEKANVQDSITVTEWEIGTPYRVQHLIPRTTYEFSVAARNKVGEGPWRTEKFVTLEETVPEPPLIRTMPETVSQYPDNFEVYWDVPDGSPILEYQIRYFKVEKGLKGWRQVEKAVEHSVVAETLSFQLTGLIPDSNYKVEIRSMNQLGYSLPEFVIIRTSKGNFGSSPEINNQTGSGSPTTPTTGPGVCNIYYCLNGGTCKEDESGRPWCICKIPFSGERCEYGDDVMKISKGIILISVASASLMVIAVILTCMLRSCIRNRK